MINFTEDLRVAARGDIASCALGEGAALLDMRTSVYYSMNEVASCVWNTIQTPTAISDICAAVEANFDVPGPVYRDEIEKLLTDLIEFDLAELR